MYEILLYSPELDQRFDHFVEKESVNGTFLQTRRFLNYHPADRFVDASFALQKVEPSLHISLALSRMVRSYRMQAPLSAARLLQNRTTQALDFSKSSKKRTSI